MEENKINTSNAFNLLEEYGNDDLIKHSLRVSLNYQKYVIEVLGMKLTEKSYDYGNTLALLHDMWEDTDLPYNFTDDKYLLNLMRLISYNKGKETYEEYIGVIKHYAKEFPEAYYVKLADIKDHLMLKDTLTDRLKEKYIGALRILL